MSSWPGLLLICVVLYADAAVEQQELEETIYSSFKFPARTPANMPADNTTLPATLAIPSGRPSSSTPNSFTPGTPELSPPALQPYKANPISKFQNLFPSQEEDKGSSMSSFHQLLASQQLDEQDRLNKFQELLATQELSRDGKPLVSLAGRVHTMAAQLDVLQQRTRVSVQHVGFYTSHAYDRWGNSATVHGPPLDCDAVWCCM